MRVARVTRTESGILQLESTFIPPLLNIEASEYVMSLARRLLELLTSKSASLAPLRRERTKGLAEFSATDVANFWLLYTVNTYLPLIRHIFDVRHGHPEVLFSTMNALAGALTTFSKIPPRDLPLYDHRDLSPRITDLHDKIRYLLETVVPSNVVALPLRNSRPSIYETSIDEDKYLQDTKLYLAIQADMPPGELIAKAPELKACSANDLDHLVRNALGGLALRHMQRAPNAIPVKLNYQYFSLNQDGPCWDAIRRARNFAAWVPADFPNPQLELIVVMP